MAPAVCFGARAAFDYNDLELAKRALEVTGQREVDTILDMWAGAHIKDDLAMFANDGRMAFLSAGAGKELAVPLRMLMTLRIRITGALLRHLPILRNKAIAPPIAIVYPLAQAADAHRHIERNAHIGNIPLSVRDA
jgi:NADPH2:quinone reductase